MHLRPHCVKSNLTPQYFYITNTNSILIWFKFALRLFVYHSDDVGVHQVQNKGKEGAVTLHLYYPPILKCNTYDKETSEATSNDLEYDKKPSKKCWSHLIWKVWDIWEFLGTKSNQYIVLGGGAVLINGFV